MRRFAQLALVMLGACNVPEVDYIAIDGGNSNSMVLRQGEAGYMGTQDTYISTVPVPGHGADLDMRWSTTDNQYSLIRFDGLDRIPAGSTIRDALLEIYVLDAGSPSGMIYEVTSSWDESTTYDTFGPNPGVTTEDRSAAQLGIVDGSAVGVVSIHVGPSITRWLQTPSLNKGWLFIPNDASLVRIASSEVTNPIQRPTLTVLFD